MPGARSNSGSYQNISAGKGGTLSTAVFIGFNGGTRCPNGDLLGIAVTQASELTTTGTTEFVRSTDGGATWTRQARVGFVDNVGELWLYSMSDGTMIASGNHNVNSSGGDPGAWPYVDPRWYQQGWISRSVDNGATWDTANTFAITDRPLLGRDGSGDQDQQMTGGYVELPDGSLIAPVAIAPNGDANRDYMWVMLVRSTDKGATWTSYGTAPFPYNVTRQAAEPSLVWLADGRLACITRLKEYPLTSNASYAMWIAYSSDQGATWTGHTRCFTSAASRPMEVVGPEGDLIVGYRTVIGSQMSGPTAWRQSWDHGQTWSAPVSTGPGMVNMYGQAFRITDTPGTSNLGLIFTEDYPTPGMYFQKLTGPAGWTSALTVTPTAVWSQSGTTITAAKAPRLIRTTTTAVVTSTSGGPIQFRGTHASRFSVSLDGTTWASSVTIPAGTSTIYIGVTPQGGDTTLTAQIGIPV